MILGLGNDIVSIERIQKVYARWGDRFVTRLLSPAERQVLPKVTVAILAKRFAAKEAFFKALGFGLSAGLSFQDVSVVHNARGAPSIVVTGETQRQCALKTVTHMHVTISDEKHYAIACVVLE